MRTMMNRQRVATAAVLAASATILAACGPQKSAGTDPSASPSSTPPAPAAVAAKAGTILISNGTASVVIGDQTVVFPTTVTDASWSPDGSRIAFVDGDGNISTMRPNGGARVVLTKPKPGFARSRPAWDGDRIEFTETDAKGVSRLMVTSANGRYARWIDEKMRQDREWPDWIGSEEFLAGTSDPSRASSNAHGAHIAQLAFERDVNGGEVWILDTNQREPSAGKLAAGHEPAISPDGTHVAYVARNGQIVVSTVRGEPVTQAGKTVQITFGAAKPTHLVWTPDGRRVAYSTPKGIESVSATVPAGTKSNATTTLATSPGVATFLGSDMDRVDRLGQPDIVDALITVSKGLFSTQTTYRVCECSDRRASGAVIANAADPATVAAATMAAGGYGTAFLVTAPDHLDPRVKAELKRIFGTVGDGKPGIQVQAGVSIAVQAELRGLGYDVERLDEGTRFAPESADAVILVSVQDHASLLLARTISDAAVLLVDGGAVPAEAQAYLKHLNPQARIYTIGANAGKALERWSERPKNRVIAFAGKDAGETSALVAQEFRATATSVLVVDQAASPVEVLIALVRSHANFSAVLISSGGSVPDAARAWLEESAASINQVIIVDATGKTVPAEVGATIGNLVSGPLGYSTGTNSLLANG